MTPPHRSSFRNDEAEASASAASGRPRAGLFGRRARAAAASALLGLLAACGGGGGNPLDNPPDISNPGSGGGDKLAFDYFQYCVAPVVTVNVAEPAKNCSNSNCHAPGGSGGAYRVIAGAALVAGGTPADAARTTDMYKNFHSAAAQAVLNAPNDSRLLNKPLNRGTLHSGGAIFASPADPGAAVISFWIANPLPPGADEFSNTNIGNRFTGGVAATANCRS